MSDPRSSGDETERGNNRHLSLDNTYLREIFLFNKQGSFCMRLREKGVCIVEGGKKGWVVSYRQPDKQPLNYANNSLITQWPVLHDHLLSFSEKDCKTAYPKCPYWNCSKYQRTVSVQQLGCQYTRRCVAYQTQINQNIVITINNSCTLTTYCCWV